ncbi:MAG: hypothetical protein ACTJF0_02745 [Psychroflexus halocasei]
MRKIKGLFYAETVSSSCEIDINWMLRNKAIVRNKKTTGTMEWTRGQSVAFITSATSKEKYLRLIYSVNNTDFDYKIQIDEVASNLGKGTILYFLCPESDKRSRVLFSAYGEPKFLNREYYHIKHGLRIYYGCQKTSKVDYNNTRYFDLKRKADKLEAELNKKHRNSHYKGKPTKDQKHLMKLKDEMYVYDKKRMAIFSKHIKKLWIGADKLK